MGKMSRDKGARGEREIASILRDYGYSQAARGCQRQGGPDSPDVKNLPGIHIEVKRTEKFSLYDALDQAKRDAESINMPAVFHRRNNHPWVVVMELADWIELYREWEAGKYERSNDQV